MSLPEVFERTRRPLDPARAIMSAAPLALLPGQGTNLTFNMETQMQTQWCWAAVAVSISKFYEPASTMSQCRVANMVLGQNGCCSNPDPCNVDNYLDKALEEVDHFRDIEPEPLPFDEVDGEMQQGRPLGCHIGWFGGGGHFVVIHGNSTDASSGSPKNWVAVADPLYGPSDYLIDDFTSAYRQGSGEWTHSYFTQ